MADALPWINVDDLLHATGARNLTKSGVEWTFSCMSANHSHGDATPSAGMNATTSLWRCRNPACGLRGNAIDYLAALKGFTQSEALRVLQERYGGPELSVEAGALEAEVERIRASRDTPDATRIMLTEDEYLDRFGIHWPDTSHADLPEPMQYMISRGFSAETLNEWSIGYDDLSGRITIPVQDENGTLVGIKGRAWQQDNDLRYITIGDAVGKFPRYGFNTYMKSQYVFGLDRAKARKTAYIVEGELNVIALWQMAIPAVAVAGAEFSERQCELIVSNFAEAVLCFDPDAAGAAGTQRVAEALEPYMPVYAIRKVAGDAADAINPSKPLTADVMGAVMLDPVPWSMVRLQATRELANRIANTPSPTGQ